MVDHSRGRCGVRIDGHGDISLKYTCLAPIAAAEEELIHSLEQLGLYDVKQHNPTGRGLPAGPDRWAAMELARDANTKYRKRLRGFCKVIEERFDAQSGGRLRAWWAAVPDPRPEEAAVAFASTTLADVLPLVAEVRGALLQMLRWRVSRGTAHAAHDALRLVRTLALKQPGQRTRPRALLHGRDDARSRPRLLWGRARWVRASSCSAVWRLACLA